MLFGTPGLLYHNFNRNGVGEWSFRDRRLQPLLPSLWPSVTPGYIGLTLIIADSERPSGPLILGNAAWNSRQAGSMDYMSFRDRRSLALRKSEAESIRRKFPNKLPVIVERYPKERSLPCLDRAKYLVPLELSMCQFTIIIRSRMALSSKQVFHLMVNNRSVASTSLTMAEIYTEFKEDDGFLYVTYASQEMFGSLGSRMSSGQ
ncbi:microtubule-associated proteins 1A/1B light chain 3C-like [Narcine bancroftii]|uniref:microtubule-associated proteins 1A/1B light chain 3C-like n=1 Tax=Narcine bancroftii TaxID=1343680 RepID=UPI003831A02E